MLLIHRMLPKLAENPFFESHRKNRYNYRQLSWIEGINHPARMVIPTVFRIILKQKVVENFYGICLHFAENGLTLHSEYYRVNCVPLTGFMEGFTNFS